MRPELQAGMLGIRGELTELFTGQFFSPTSTLPELILNQDMPVGKKYKKSLLLFPQNVFHTKIGGIFLVLMNFWL